MSAMNSSGAVINERAQRPERVNVRIMDELMPPQHQPFGGPAAFNRGREVNKSPVHLHGQSNLATLAHVAHNHKQMTQPFPSSGHTKPLTIQTISPRSTGSASYGSPSSNHSFTSPTIRQTEQPPTKYMPLPRADMKLNWESYFNESKSVMHQGQQQKPMAHPKNQPDESHRTNGAPLEGEYKRVPFWFWFYFVLNSISYE